MNDMTDQKRRSLTKLVSKSIEVYDAGLKQSVATVKYATQSAYSMLEAALFPTLDAVVHMNQQLTHTMQEVLQGEKSWQEAMLDTGRQVETGARFEHLVHTWGRTLFGSARFEDEQVLGTTEHFRLCYLPPAADVAPAPIAAFYAGGCIPYGDRIFRLLPDYNLYARFRERGIPLYIMELAGDRDHINYADLTMDSLIDTLDQLSDAAFAHHRRGALPSRDHKLALIGYCGQGTQALAYLAARPQDADTKFSTFLSFATPVDGTRCGELARAARDMPDICHQALVSYYGALGALGGVLSGHTDATGHHKLPGQAGGYLPGELIQTSLDLSLGALFHKTSLGYFSAGWERTDLAGVRSIGDLTASQQRDLASVYWISSDCSRRFPIPLDIVRFTTALFKQGIAPDGVLPYPIQGRDVSLSAIATDTNMRLIGCYGGKDPIAPHETAHVLASLLGERYTHVVHPQAGHISYVLSPNQWRPDSKRALTPNPLDLLLQEAERAETRS